MRRASSSSSSSRRRRRGGQRDLVCATRRNERRLVAAPVGVRAERRGAKRAGDLRERRRRRHAEQRERPRPAALGCRDRARGRTAARPCARSAALGVSARERRGPRRPAAQHAHPRRGPARVGLRKRAARDALGLRPRLLARGRAPVRGVGLAKRARRGRLGPPRSPEEAPTLRGHDRDDADEERGTNGARSVPRRERRAMLGLARAAWRLLLQPAREVETPWSERACLL